MAARLICTLWRFISHDTGLHSQNAVLSTLCCQPDLPFPRFPRFVLTHCSSPFNTDMSPISYPVSWLLHNSNFPAQSAH
ncbi:uncharacterized protein CC84DRAFT_467196 [Paraphaeosphaeria sporulosa]|uniref:Uncharacterized protein n=1 Tax=Paraphaeosphaeria sporulosa TaxID=1460663 RepID=A0A177CSI6_9PLEO|nr:uncharacterized protein CC84DRAFT_467196 [Paraphaeosphaeria sporulosa]OAG10161.1 hypothetical protein CC84DRAFT_467196 [Paraphaeosphaeria sporulosa]